MFDSKRKARKRDFMLVNIGAVYVLRPMTKRAENYIQSICDEPEYPALWPILVLEPPEVQETVEDFTDQNLTFV